MNSKVSESLVAPEVTDKLDFEPLATEISAQLLSADENENALQLVGIFGPWGSGKTHLLKRLGKHLAKRNRLVIAFSAWEHEFENDITKSLIARLGDPESFPWQSEAPFQVRLRSLRSQTAFKQLWESLPNNINVGLPVGSIQVSIPQLLRGLGAILRRTGFEDYPNTYKTRKAFGQTLQELRKEDYSHTYILIDDLDRCEPNNAITFLASLKNLLQVEHCTFVMGLDDDAVKAALDSMYGAYVKKENSSEDYGLRYLRKLFDFTYRIPVGRSTLELVLTSVSGCTTLEAYLQQRTGANADESVVDALLWAINQSSRFENPRTALRIFRVYDLALQMMFDLIPKESKGEFSYLAAWLILHAIRSEGIPVYGTDIHRSRGGVRESASTKGFRQMADGDQPGRNETNDKQVSVPTHAEQHLMGFICKHKYVPLNHSAVSAIKGEKV